MHFWQAYSVGPSGPKTHNYLNKYTPFSVKTEFPVKQWKKIPALNDDDFKTEFKIIVIFLLCYWIVTVQSVSHAASACLIFLNTTILCQVTA